MMSQSRPVFRYAFLAASVFFFARAVAAQENPKKNYEVDYGTQKLVLPVPEGTEMKGKIPYDFSGDWLALAQVDLMGKARQTTLEAFRVSKKGDEYLIRSFVVQLPKAIDGDFQANRAKAGGDGWQPTKEQLDEIITAFRANPWPIDETTAGKYILTDKKTLATTKVQQKEGALFALDHMAKAGDGVYAIGYFPHTVDRASIDGAVNMGVIVVSGAGIPVPLGGTGTFKMTRLDAAEPSGATPSKDKSAKK